MAVTRKTKNLATSKVAVEQVYLDQLKGTISQLERKVENLTEKVENEEGLGMEYVDDVQLVLELAERLNRSSGMDQDQLFAALVRELTPIGRENLLSAVSNCGC